VTARGIVRRRIELLTFFENSLTRYVVYFQSNTVEILEKKGVISGGPRPLLGRMNDRRLLGDRKIVNRIHIFPGPYTKAELNVEEVFGQSSSDDGPSGRSTRKSGEKDADLVSNRKGAE
jgi:hypothetical protein